MTDDFILVASVLFVHKVCTMSHRQLASPPYHGWRKTCRTTAGSTPLTWVPWCCLFFSPSVYTQVGPDRARRLAVRLKSLNDKYEELVRCVNFDAAANGVLSHHLQLAVGENERKEQPGMGCIQVKS